MQVGGSFEEVGEYVGAGAGADGDGAGDDEADEGGGPPGHSQGQVEDAPAGQPGGCGVCVLRGAQVSAQGVGQHGPQARPDQVEIEAVVIADAHGCGVETVTDTGGPYWLSGADTGSATLRPADSPGCLGGVSVVDAGVGCAGEGRFHVRRGLLPLALSAAAEPSGGRQVAGHDPQPLQEDAESGRTGP